MARLLTGIVEVPDAARAAQAQFLLQKQNDDGGFAGREGPSDLYYTSFGMRGLALVGELTGDRAHQLGEFLRSRLSRQESIVDFYSLIYAARLLHAVTDIEVFDKGNDSWRDGVAELLSSLRRQDGGFAKGEAGHASSTYHSFLALLCYQLIERPVENSGALVDFFRSQRMEEGGYREVRVSKRPGTNPTAAAVAGLLILNALEDEARTDTAEFLADMQGDEGGFCANTRIPFCDLLSTFTALLTLSDLQATELVDLPAARRFASALTDEDGGFLGAVWDEVRDVEYTFYGVGTLALLATL